MSPLRQVCVLLLLLLLGAVGGLNGKARRRASRCSDRHGTTDAESGKAPGSTGRPPLTQKRLPLHKAVFKVFYRLGSIGNDFLRILLIPFKPFALGYIEANSPSKHPKASGAPASTKYHSPAATTTTTPPKHASAKMSTARPANKTPVNPSSKSNSGTSQSKPTNKPVSPSSNSNSSTNQSKPTSKTSINPPSNSITSQSSPASAGLVLFSCNTESSRMVCIVLSTIVCLVGLAALIVVIIVLALLLRSAVGKRKAKVSRQVFFRNSDSSMATNSIFDPGNRLLVYPQSATSSSTQVAVQDHGEHRYNRVKFWKRRN